LGKKRTDKKTLKGPKLKALSDRMDAFKIFKDFLKRLLMESDEPCLEETTLCARSGNKVYVGLGYFGNHYLIQLTSVFARILQTFSVRSLTYIVPKEKLEENEKMYGPHPFRERFKRRGNNYYAEFNVEKDLTERTLLLGKGFRPLADLLIRGARFRFNGTEIKLLDSKEGSFMLIKTKKPQVWVEFFRELYGGEPFFEEISAEKVEKFLK
jgi:hypothetical protein